MPELFQCQITYATSKENPLMRASMSVHVVAVDMGDVANAKFPLPEGAFDEQMQSISRVGDEVVLTSGVIPH